MASSSSSSSSSSHVLLLCIMVVVASLSLHACNARHLVTSRPAHVVVGADERSSPESASEAESTKMRGRELMLGNHGAEADVRETKDAEEEAEESGGAVVVMDYAQPHRKPPIHNEKH